MLKTNSKVKILYIHHGTGIGGAPISLINIINELDKEKFDVFVGLLNSGGVESLFKENEIKYEIIGGTSDYFAHNLTPKIHWKYFYRYIKIYKHWKTTALHVAPSFIKKHKPDIIHLNSHVLTDWAYAAKRLGVKVVLHNREAIAKGYFGFRHGVLRKLIQENCDYIINISEDNKKRLGINEEHSIVAYNFVDIPNSYRVPMKGTNNKPIKVLYLGGMAYIKGYPTVVKSLEFLNPNIVVQFGGHYGNVANNKSVITGFKNLIKIFMNSGYKYIGAMHKAQNSQYLGFLKDSLSYIDECDILITPFTNEHFSRPAIEAFAYGKPVIGSNVEGMDEIITHNLNGLLIEKNNPRALADAINYLCSNPDIAVRMGREGREKAITNFSPEVNISKVLEIYEELMNQ